MTPRVVAAYAQAFWQMAEQAQLSITDLLRVAQVSSTQDDVHPLTYMRLLNLAAERSHNAFFGLQTGAQLRLPNYAVYGVGLLSCRDMREAVTQVMRYESLAHDLGRSEIIEGGEHAEYRWHSPWLAQLPCHHLPESVFAGIAVFVRWLLHEAVTAYAVEFTHAAPADAEQYDIIFRCPVRFNAPYNRILFAPEILQQRLPNADPSVQLALRAHADSLLAARAQPAEPVLQQQLRRLLTERLARGDVKLATLASDMAMSSRSLQRHLEKLGTSFQHELDRTRKELAQRYVHDPKLSLTEVAFLLGYSEQSAFTHAFRDWFGVAPSQWRNKVAK